MTSVSIASGLGREKASGWEAVRGEEVGKENASWVEEVIFRRSLADEGDEEKILDSQPIV